MASAKSMLIFTALVRTTAALRMAVQQSVDMNMMTGAIGSKLIQSTTEPQRDLQPRRAYFDLGANWANTLRLYKDLANASQVDQHPWEVYAFEASPLIVPYVDKFVTFLNGHGPKPELLWPPAGSSEHLSKYAKRYGCSQTKGYDAMRECMWRTFKKPLSMMVPDESLMTNDVINSRMAQASLPPTDSKDRFVLVPAAAGASAGQLHLGHVDAEQMIRGGAIDSVKTGKQLDVPIANFVSMLEDNFQEKDYVVVKMDVEGGEFPIIKALMEHNKIGLIDVLALECHSFAGDCKQLLQQCGQLAGKVLVEGREYEGIDSDSLPEKYYPTDPRK